MPRMRRPEAPSGWPMEMAPPQALTIPWSISQARMQARDCAAKASLSSTAAISDHFSPALARALLAASTGAKPKNCGSRAEAPLETMRAIGSRPSSVPPFSEPMNAAEAPSLIGEALPAVTVAFSPVRNTVRSWDRVSAVESARMVSSRVNSVPRLLAGGTGTTRLSYFPASQAAAACWCERAENSSWSSREMLCFSRSCSVASPSETVHAPGMAGLTRRQPRVVLASSRLLIGKGRSVFGRTQGARDIDSTPPTSTRSASPVATWRDAAMEASSEEPHKRFMVVPGSEVGRPASRVAMRATLRFSSPAPLALPKIDSSMVLVSSFGDRATSSRTTCAARSSGRWPDSAPPILPKGVRIAS